MKDWTLRLLRRLTMGPAMRVSFGLSSLVVALLLAADLGFGLLPDQAAQLRQQRARTAENVALQAAMLMELAPPRALDRLLHELLVRETSVLSAAVRRDDGSIVAQAGDHAAVWIAAAGGVDRIDNISVPLKMNGSEWGAVELGFQRIGTLGWGRWLHDPVLLLVALLGVGSFICFTLFLRRVLAHLDPSAVIPQRVRSAFDVFYGGVMIVDPSRRVMLANVALRTWMGSPPDEGLNGRAVETLTWFKQVLPADQKEHPWAKAMATGVAQEGCQLEFVLASGAPLRAVVNASPIMDGSRKVRGCLVTFENVTPLHDLNSQLVRSMAPLEESKTEVEKKNSELQELATRDPLTGCLNRRSAFAKLDKLFLEARHSGQPLCCIMTDIDHFKLFNDRHGHAVGDQVLQAVTRSLGSALREVDLLCRYGGEEFLIILPGVDPVQACAVAERLRVDVQTRAGASIRSTSGLEVTSSFGVATLGPDITDPAQMIDQADQALYSAKKGGRNCVMTYSSKTAMPQSAPEALTGT